MSISQHKLTFEGLYTAIITPFTKSGEVDYDAFLKLLQMQAEGGVAGVVVCGTTGESPNITDLEFAKLLEMALQVGRGKFQVIAGTGTNSTDKTIAKSRLAQQHGAQALLIASPYYNKPSQAGLLAHFRAVADSTDLPVIVYNVPGRTAVNIETPTLKELTNHPNIVAVKEASGSINQIMDVIEAVDDDFAVLAGDDAITLPMIAAGGRGVISVISNEAPGRFNEMVQLALKGDIAEARNIHYELLPLMKANFWESNPTIVKKALHQMGIIEEVLRLPLVPAGTEHNEPLRKLLQNLNLLTKSD